MKPSRRAEVHSFAVVALLLAVALSGCTDKSVECEGGVCKDVAQPGDVFLTNATRPVASWEGCQGVFMNIDLPRDMVDPYVPAGFDGLGDAAFLRDVRLEMMDCPRATIDGHVIQPFRYATTGVFVAPTNTSWEGSSTVGDFLYEVFVSNETAARLLARWGLPAVPASIEIDRTQTGPLVSVATRIATDDRSYAFTAQVVDEPGATTSFPFALWSGEGEYQRVDSNYTRTQARNVRGATPITMTGAAMFAEILGTDTAVLNTQAYLVAADEWQPHPTPFSSRET